MNRPRSHRLVSVLLALVVLTSVTGISLRDAGAKPVATTASISTRVQAQRDMCETIGGGKLTVTPLRGGPMNTTTCTGGDHDGQTCVNEMASTDCTQARTGETVPAQADQPEVADPGDNPGAPDLRGPTLAAMCHAMAGVGSTATGEDGATATRCEGGLLDTIGCVLEPGGGWCVQGLAGPLPVDAVRPAEAVDAAATLPETEFVDIADLDVTPVVLEEPVMVGGVIYNQSGSTVNDNATSQAALCRLLGGVATVTTERTGAGGLVWADVQCTGGLLDGMYCANQVVAPSNCFRARQQTGSGPEIVTPLPEREQPAATTAPATMIPTQPPTEIPTPTDAPTMAPTEAPAEPTAAPPGGLPTIPGDNAVPPGEAEIPEEPEPTMEPIT